MRQRTSPRQAAREQKPPQGWWRRWELRHGNAAVETVAVRIGGCAGRVGETPAVPGQGRNRGDSSDAGAVGRRLLPGNESVW